MIDWREKLNPYQREHFSRATHRKDNISAFKNERDYGLISEPIYGCCFECWIIANVLGLENTFTKANIDKWLATGGEPRLLNEYLDNAGINLKEVK